jgi:hypothetical protein
LRTLALIAVLGAAGCWGFRFDFLPESPDAGPCAGHGSSVEKLVDCACPLRRSITAQLDGTSCDHAGVSCTGGWFGVICTCEADSLRWSCGARDLSIPVPPSDLARLDD